VRLTGSLIDEMSWIRTRVLSDGLRKDEVYIEKDC
jgi:hypothetical protein